MLKNFVFQHTAKSPKASSITLLKARNGRFLGTKSFTVLAINKLG
jgi:hypothetical protein